MSCAFCSRSKASSKHLHISFHSFPKDDVMKKAWVKACVSRGCVIGEKINSLKLCSVHFTSNDYETSTEVRTCLKRGVVPSRFWRKPYMHCIVCSDIGSANPDVYLHTFPEDSILKKKWIDACRQIGFNIQCVYHQHRLCSKHFPLNCFAASNDERKYLKPDAIPLIFPLSISSTCAGTVQHDENLITNEIADAESVYSVADFCSVVSCDDTSKNAPSTSKCVDDYTTAVKKSVKRRLPFTNTSESTSPPKSTKKKVWRPARVGELREEHFATPRSAKRNFHILSGKCNEYKKIIANYRTKIWRLEKKVENLENLLSHLVDKKLISEDTAADISMSEDRGKNTTITVEIKPVQYDDNYINV